MFIVLQDETDGRSSRSSFWQSSPEVQEVRMVHSDGVWETHRSQSQRCLHQHTSTLLPSEFIVNGFEQRVAPALTLAVIPLQLPNPNPNPNVVGVTSILD